MTAYASMTAGSTPVVWAGPIGNWLKACRLLLDLDVDTIVPGHGPVCGPETVRATERYFEFVLDQGVKKSIEMTRLINEALAQTGPAEGAGGPGPSPQADSADGTAEEKPAGS